MATLKKQATSSPQLVSEYRGKTVVFLEGETDVNLFRNYWFKHRLDKLDFTEPQNGIGCVGVVQNVISYRKNGIHTYRQCRACLQRRNREQIKRGRK